MNEQAERFAQQITSWDIDQLLVHYAQTFAANSYGSRNEELAIVREEIASRVSS